MGYAEGDHRPGSLHHQDQDHRSPREEVLRLDRWLHPGLPLPLPADVDLQAGVRRVRSLHRPSQVLLSALSMSSTVVMIVHASTESHPNHVSGFNYSVIFIVTVVLSFPKLHSKQFDQ